MTVAEMVTAAVLVTLAALFAPTVYRLVQSVQIERRRRRQRLVLTLTELQLQHLTHLTLAQLLDQARRSMGDLDRPR